MHQQAITILGETLNFIHVKILSLVPFSCNPGLPRRVMRILVSAIFYFELKRNSIPRKGFHEKNTAQVLKKKKAGTKSIFVYIKKYIYIGIELLR